MAETKHNENNKFNNTYQYIKMKLLVIKLQQIMIIFKDLCGILFYVN